MGGVPQVLLQPDGGHHAAAEELVEVELRGDVGLLRRHRDGTAQEVVGHEQPEERQPLEHHPSPAAPRGDAERGHPEAEPEEELVARQRQPPLDHGEGQRDDVDDGRADDEDAPTYAP